MGKGLSFLLLALFLCHALTVTTGYEGEKQWRKEREREESEQEEEEGGRRTDDIFLMRRSTRVIRTDAGEMRVVRSPGGRIMEKPLHIGFITMEPQSLFIPQYLDSSLILFVRTGEARVGCIYEDEMVERRLNIGDVFPIPAGSAFYILNPGEGQRLHIICSIDPYESLNLDTFQSFFIGGGAYPASVLAGFSPETLSSAFNVSVSRLTEFLSRQKDGPIVHVAPSHAPSIWTKFSQLKEEDRLKKVKRMVLGEVEQVKEWSWWNLFGMLSGNEENLFKDKAPDSYNIYKRSPDFRNNYGWSVAVDGSVYKPLKDHGTSIYLVNLTAGSMMAPHVNPRATEYGIVLRGSGRILIVFPNGTLAMDTKVREGDVFWVPRYFAFCQLASRSSPFEFFGFTTSSHKNMPQFLVGANSLLHTFNTPELAAAFGVSEERMRRFINAQNEAVILPAAPGGGDEDEDVKRAVKFRNGMTMGFD
ncbi:LOB domain-containing protein 11-like [Hibiscus syriacus]|uniref:LOB domain-containing protein 11-like n=1 Tax=Hibiscus syriacus TaxID=106335 RepID=A0A6A2ZG78_HIBSY|nr:vicilin-like seed storage protein At2g28490 [Hibiscus syriacus]KAE8691024.1 LOB domain-containing protein 11-like [Hibiscus syriacus]